jgi:hypothetical protein
MKTHRIVWREPTIIPTRASVLHVNPPTRNGGVCGCACAIVETATTKRPA